MNDLSISNATTVRDSNHHCCSCNPIPRVFLYIVIALFLLGLSVSIFILVVVHNAVFFLSLLALSALLLAFILWNTLNWNSKTAILFFVRSLPDSDLRLARHGQLVKITGECLVEVEPSIRLISSDILAEILVAQLTFLGVSNGDIQDSNSSTPPFDVSKKYISSDILIVQLASCGSVSLESSYEKATRCIYASTFLYEYRGFDLKPVNVNTSCFQWSLAYCERFATDFYITDRKSGVRAVVKAGSNSKVIPLVIESKLVNTTRQCRILSPNLRKWLRERNLSEEARLLRLEEGYVQEGSCVTVIGMLHRNNDIVMIIQPPEAISTGCLWQKLLLPVDIDGLILRASQLAGPVNQESIPHPDR